MISQGRKNGGLRLFRLRFSKHHDRLVLNNAALPPTVLFSRSLEALKINGLNRSVALTASGARAKDPSAVDLQEASTGIFQPFGETNSVLYETMGDTHERGFGELRGG